jgi:hypothetical protein
MQLLEGVVSMYPTGSVRVLLAALTEEFVMRLMAYVIVRVIGKDIIVNMLRALMIVMVTVIVCMELAAVLMVLMVMIVHCIHPYLIGRCCPTLPSIMTILVLQELRLSCGAEPCGCLADISLILQLMPTQAALVLELK